MNKIARDEAVVTCVIVLGTVAMVLDYFGMLAK